MGRGRELAATAATGARARRVAAASVVALALGGCGDDGKPKQTAARPEATTLSFEAAASPRLPAALGPGDDVRISGLVVGSVTNVARSPSQAVVRMRIRIRPAWPVEAGVWPPRTNATIIVRPRIFKEGDFFMDLTPGTYKAPELKEGARLPASRTRLQPPSLLTG